MADREQVDQLLVLLGAAYPNAPITDATRELYVQAFSPFDAEILNKAMIMHIKTSKWFPSVHELVRAVMWQKGFTRQEPLALEAWGQAMEAIRHYGYYRPELAQKALGERIWKAITNIGGWQYLCSSEDTLMSDRARFVEVYDQSIEREYAERLQMLDTENDVSEMREGRNELIKEMPRLTFKKLT